MHPAFTVPSTLLASMQRLFSCTSLSEVPETAPSSLTRPVSARNLGSVGGSRLVLDVQLSREGKTMPVTMQWDTVPRRGSLCGSDHRHHMAMAWSRPMSAEPPAFGPRSPSDLCPSLPPNLYCPQILGKSSHCPSVFSSTPWGGFFKLTHSSLSDPRLFPGPSHSFPFLQPIKMSYTKPGVVLHACNPSTQRLGQEDHELTASLTNLPESMASGKPPAGRNTSTSGLVLTSQQTQQRHSANR